MTAEKRTGRGKATRERTCGADYTKPQRKWRRVLKAFLAGASLNRIDAARKFGDFCLPTTVANMQARRIAIVRHFEIVPGFGGYSMRVTRYRLDRAAENIARARALLKSHTGPRRCARAERVGEHRSALVDTKAAG